MIWYLAGIGWGNRIVLAHGPTSTCKGLACTGAHPSPLTLGLMEATINKSVVAQDGARQAVEGFVENMRAHFHCLKAPPASYVSVLARQP